MWDKNQHPQHSMCVNFQAERTNLTFSAQICLKMNFWDGISKIENRIWNQNLQGTKRVNFQSKWTTLNFSAYIAQLRAIFWF